MGREVRAASVRRQRAGGVASQLEVLAVAGVCLGQKSRRARFEELDRKLVELACPLAFTLRDERGCELGVRTTEIDRMEVAEACRRAHRDRGCLVEPTELDERASALDLEGRLVVVRGVIAEKLQSSLGESKSLLGVAGVELDEREKMVGARVLLPVLARL